MVIITKDFKDVCSTVLAAIDTSELSTLTETLELKTVGTTLYLNVTNKEYYVSVKFPLDQEETFRAAVNANLFLKLVAAITSETIELTVNDNYVNVKANGNYKIPLIFENDQLMTVPEIKIENKTVEMNVAGSVLESIVNYNSKEIPTTNTAKPVQRMFYFDEQGCITFVSGACVNSFTLPTPVKVLFNMRLVNLFKLFKNEMVKFTLGYDPLSETITQTKVSFETPSITLTAITGCDDNLIAQVPVAAIRDRATKEYPYRIVLNTTALKEAINRLALFNPKSDSKQEIKPYSTFSFTPESVTIYDVNQENTETLAYQNDTTVAGPYNMILDVMKVKKILDTCTEQYVTMNFGDDKACVIVRNAIRNVLPQGRA